MKRVLVGVAVGCCLLLVMQVLQMTKVAGQVAAPASDAHNGQTSPQTGDATARDKATGAAEAGAPAGGRSFYVDFDGGNDKSNGTSIATAWKHCPGDPEAAGTLAGTALMPGDTIVFRGGVVYRGAISCNWSGAAGRQIVYDGNTAGTWGTGKAIIDGSEPVRDWTRCKSAEEAGGNANWANIWYAYAPAATTAGNSNLYQFDTKDHMCWLAQDPNPKDPLFPDDVNDWYTIPRENMTTTSVTDPAHLNQSDPHHWDGASVMLWLSGNVIWGRNITGFDPDTDTITYDKTKDPYTQFDERYTLYNSIHLIDVPGEYYYQDAAEPDGTHKVWLWPPAGNPNTHQVTASTKRYGFAVDYSGKAAHSYITIQGFEIRKCSGDSHYNDGSGVRIFCSSGHQPHASVNVLDCDFWGIRMSYLGNHNWGKGAIAVSYLNGGVIRGNNIFECPHICGILFLDSHGITIEKNTINRAGHVGIWCAGSHDSKILDNVVTGYDGGHADGMTIYSKSTNIQVSRNFLKGRNTGIGFDYGDNVTVSYNEIHVDSGGFFGLAMWKPMTNLRIHNNTVLRDDGKLSFNRNPGCTCEAKNNIFHANSNASLKPDADNNLWISPALETDLFADPGKGDCHLKSTSPARNAGTPLDYVSDREGKKVPQEEKPDIGCHEYVPEETE